MKAFGIRVWGSGSGVGATALPYPVSPNSSSGARYLRVGKVDSLQS